MIKNLPVNTGDPRGVGSIPGLERSPGVGNGTLHQYSSLENSMGRGVWQITVHGTTKSWTQLSTQLSFLKVLNITQTLLSFPKCFISFNIQNIITDNYIYLSPSLPLSTTPCPACPPPPHHSWKLCPVALSGRPGTRTRFSSQAKPTPSQLSASHCWPIGGRCVLVRLEKLSLFYTLEWKIIVYKNSSRLRTIKFM